MWKTSQVADARPAWMQPRKAPRTDECQRGGRLLGACGKPVEFGMGTLYNIVKYNCILSVLLLIGCATVGLADMARE